jgi:hypothetical protein
VKFLKVGEKCAMKTLDWFTLATSLIGAGLGIYNLIIARRKEAREVREKESAQRDNELEWEIFSTLSEASKEGKLLFPKTGSVEHRIAERLVEKRMLVRFPGGGYGIPGQSIAISTKP